MSFWSFVLNFYFYRKRQIISDADYSINDFGIHNKDLILFLSGEILNHGER